MAANIILLAVRLMLANGETMPEPTFNVEHVGESVLYISNLPLDANIQFVTIMATQMPYVGRG